MPGKSRPAFVRNDGAAWGSEELSPALGFFAEEFDVGGAFFYRGALSALDLFADLLDDVGIG